MKLSNSLGVFFSVSLFLFSTFAQANSDELKAIEQQLGFSLKRTERLIFEQSLSDGDHPNSIVAGWYYFGLFQFDQDYSKAITWYKTAADQNDADSQYWLGHMAENGEGQSADYTVAFDWYSKSAAQNYADAQYALAGLYEEGNGVEQSYESALEWYKKAFNNAYVDAANDIGWAYANGLGVSNDENQAFQWYLLGAEAGSAAAQFNTGMSYYNGDGVEEDNDQALRWLKASAAQDYPEAIEMLESF